MSLTTLAGTTWLIDDSPSTKNYIGDYSIKLPFTWKAGSIIHWETYVQVTLEYTSGSIPWHAGTSTITFTKSSGTTLEAYNSDDGWDNTRYQTWSIPEYLCGDDVTNATLIAFLENKATLLGFYVSYKEGDYGTGDNDSDYKDVGVDLTLWGITFTRSGYVQDGWSINSDGSTLDYALEGTYSADVPITLYPHWAVAPFKAYAGVNNVAKKLTTGYVGVNGTAKKITKGYVGVNGVAKQIF